MAGLGWNLGSIAGNIPSTKNYWGRELPSAKWQGEKVLWPTQQMITLEMARNMVGNLTKNTDEKNLNSMMSTFNSMYKLRGPPEIRAFLEINDFLNPLVYEAYSKLQKYFPNSPIFMEVDQNELVILVGTTLSPEEADEKLHNFDEEWWIDASENSKARLCITVEFQ